MTIKQNRTRDLKCNHCPAIIPVGDLKFDLRGKGKSLCLECKESHVHGIGFVDGIMNRPPSGLLPKPIYAGSKK